MGWDIVPYGDKGMRDFEEKYQVNSSLWSTLQIYNEECYIDFIKWKFYIDLTQYGLSIISYNCTIKFRYMVMTLKNDNVAD